MPQAVRTVDRIRDQGDFQGTLTDGHFLSYDAGADAFLLAPQAPGSTEGVWDYSTSTVMDDPGAGKVRINAASPAGATQVALDALTAGGVDAANLLGSLKAGDGLYVQDKDNGANWARYALTGAALANAGWFLLPVSYASGAGAAIANNSPLLISFTHGGSGGGSPGGTPGQLQYNSSGALGGTAGVVYAAAGTLAAEAPASGAGLALTLKGSSAVSGNTAGGSVVLTPGAKFGTGADGSVVVKAATASPAANLQEWQSSAGAAMAVVTASGKLGIGITTPGAANANNLIELAGTNNSLLRLTGTGGNFVELNPQGRVHVAAENLELYGAGLTSFAKVYAGTATFDGLARASTAGVAVRGAAGQAANLQEWQSSAGAVLSSVSENGYFTTRKNAAPADAELLAGELAFWFDQTNGAARLVVKAKQADGTVRTGSVALT